MIDKKLALIFWFVCIPARIFEVFLLGYYFDQLRIAFIVILSVQTLGFVFNSISGRNLIIKGDQDKGSFGQERWWFGYAHAFFFGATTVAVISNLSGSFYILAVDVLFGILSWLVHYLFFDS